MEDKIICSSDNKECKHKCPFFLFQTCCPYRNVNIPFSDIKYDLNSRRYYGVEIYDRKRYK